MGFQLLITSTIIGKPNAVVIRVVLWNNKNDSIAIIGLGQTQL